MSFRDFIIFLMQLLDLSKIANSSQYYFFSFLFLNEGSHSLTTLRRCATGTKVERSIICNTRGIEIVRCHAATSTIHKLEGRRREDRGKVKVYFFKNKD